jgi:hypothetical protein
MLAATTMTDRFRPNLPGQHIEFRPASPRELPALSSFLSRRFHVRAGAALVDERHLAWKYWSERSDWHGPRSFTARHEGAIVAHAAVWPLRIRVSDRIVPTVHLIDWAASPRYLGAGIWLMRQIRATVPAMIATGGRDITRRILPAIGFRAHSELSVFARPVRPLSQAMTSPAGNHWKLPARLARNAVWALSNPASWPRGWSAAPLMPERIPDHLWPRASPTTAVAARDADLFRYFVDSPSTRHAMLGLERGGELVGYCCLSLVGHLARIADIWLPSTRIADWSDAYRTAAAAAACERGVYEVSAWASTALGRAALTGAGFRERDRSAISLLGDPILQRQREVHVQMIDCDASFLSGDSPAYLT